MDFVELLRLEAWGNASVCGCPEARRLRHQHRHPLVCCSAAEDRQMASGRDALLSSMELTKGHSSHGSSKKPRPQTRLWCWCSDTDLWKVCIWTVTNFGSCPPKKHLMTLTGPGVYLVTQSGCRLCFFCGFAWLEICHSNYRKSSMPAGLPGQSVGFVCWN